VGRERHKRTKQALKDRRSPRERGRMGTSVKHILLTCTAAPYNNTCAAIRSGARIAGATDATASQFNDDGSSQQCEETFRKNVTSSAAAAPRAKPALNLGPASFRGPTPFAVGDRVSCRNSARSSFRRRRISGSFHTSECRGGVHRRQLKLKGVEVGRDCERGTLGGEKRRAKSLRNGVHYADAVVWEPV